MNLKKLKNESRGSINAPLIFFVIMLALGSIIFFTGSSFKVSPSPDPPGQVYTPDAIPTGDGKRNLQLDTLKFKKVEIPKGGNTCVGSKFNEEPDIFVGSDPPANGIATANGVIRVWIDDGNGGSVSSGEVLDPSTGAITTPGDRNAIDGVGPNYYRWEPALYVTPITSIGQPGPYSGDAENGGTPHFPQTVRGKVLNSGSGRNSGYLSLPPIDSPIGFDTRVRREHGGNMAQFNWDVAALGLAPGLYRAQFVIHDGDGDIAVNCTTIQI